MICEAILNGQKGDHISPNGRLPTTLPEPIKRARVKDIRGFAGEGNVAERSERMRAKRSPTSPSRIILSWRKIRAHFKDIRAYFIKPA